MSYAIERRVLQFFVAVAGLVPVGAGLRGVTFGLDAPGAFLDSHYRYLSGLLLAIGLIFWASIPAIEKRGVVVRTLTIIVVVGGLARLGAALAGEAGPTTQAALIMELFVTPLLWAWRERIERMDPARYRGPWQ